MTLQQEPGILFSDAGRKEVPETAELRRIYAETEIERVWWTAENKFLDKSAELRAINNGLLIKIPRNGEGWRLIGILNGEENGEPNTLRPEALELLNRVTEEWHKLSVPNDVYIAITSLYRSQKHQAAMDDNSSIKGTGSSHLAGGAFDISLRSYYLKQGDKFISVKSWDDKEGLYREEYIKALVKTVDEFRERQDCNAVIERKIADDGIIPSVLHICVNPTKKTAV